MNYRDLEQMMDARGVLADHSTSYRGVQWYAPKITRDICGEARIVERAFGLGASAPADTVRILNNRLELAAT